MILFLTVLLISIYTNIFVYKINCMFMMILNKEIKDYIKKLNIDK